MIDITVDNNKVTVDMKEFRDFNSRSALLDLIIEIVEKAKFSGETIELFVLHYPDKKEFIKQWP